MKRATLQDEKTDFVRNVIAVFARAPRMGEVKTRLAKSVGDERARDIYIAMLRDVFAYAKSVASQIAHCEVVVFYTPESAFGRAPDSLRALWNGARRPQSEGDLGDKLCACFAVSRKGGARNVVVIGTDAPDLPMSFLVEAFRALVTSDFVFGASDDGGFYLMGASCDVDLELLHGVRWSSENTLRDVLRNVGERRVRFLPPWRDVDDIDDLRALNERLRNRESVAPQTHRVLDVEGVD